MGQCWPWFRRRVRELNPCCAGGSGHNRYTEFAPQDKMKYSDETLLHQISSGRPASTADVVYEGIDGEDGGTQMSDYPEDGEQYRGAIRLPLNDEEEDSNESSGYAKSRNSRITGNSGAGGGKGRNRDAGNSSEASLSDGPNARDVAIRLMHEDDDEKVIPAGTPTNFSVLSYRPESEAGQSLFGLDSSHDLPNARS